MIETCDHRSQNKQRKIRTLKHRHQKQAQDISYIL